MDNKFYCRPPKPATGFTVIEILLVIVIIGVVVAMVLPRAWRANIGAKYTVVRQSATELGNWGMFFTARNLEAQLPALDCNLNDYVATLQGYTGDTATNWAGINNVTCSNAASTNITGPVESLMAPEKKPRNPFNGLSYFNPGNNGAVLQSGLLYLSMQTDSAGYRNYYFVYTGTDSTTASDWHADMGAGTSPLLVNLKNGVFLAKLQP